MVSDVHRSCYTAQSVLDFRNQFQKLQSLKSTALPNYRSSHMSTNTMRETLIIELFCSPKTKSCHIFRLTCSNLCGPKRLCTLRSALCWHQLFFQVPPPKICENNENMGTQVVHPDPTHLMRMRAHGVVLNLFGT